MTALLHITEAESAVLEPLWRLGPLTPVRLLSEVRSVQPWADPTIKTLLGRLMQKKIVRSEREEGVLRYRALVERSSYLASEVQTLVDRLFHGDRLALTAFLRDAEPS